MEGAPSCEARILHQRQDRRGQKARSSSGLSLRCTPQIGDANELREVDQWVRGTIEKARALIKLTNAEQFHAAPADPPGAKDETPALE